MQTFSSAQIFSSLKYVRSQFGIGLSSLTHTVWTHRKITLANPIQASLLRLAASGISVFSPHTSLDAVSGGINDWCVHLSTHFLSPQGYADGPCCAYGSRPVPIHHPIGLRYHGETLPRPSHPFSQASSPRRSLAHTQTQGWAASSASGRRSHLQRSGVPPSRISGWNMVRWWSLNRWVDKR